jgi:hypothetical protein
MRTCYRILHVAQLFSSFSHPPLSPLVLYSYLLSLVVSFMYSLSVPRLSNVLWGPSWTSD